MTCEYTTKAQLISILLSQLLSFGTLNTKIHNLKYTSKEFWGRGWKPCGMCDAIWPVTMSVTWRPTGEDYEILT